jgi:hypothetical protein
VAHPDAEKRAQALLEQGAGLYEQGKLYEALSCWKQVLQIDPQNEIATEYLRFIEDNFQIGVDAFLEHHEREPDSVGARSLEAQDSLAAENNDSYEELDWSEILDEGPDRNLRAAAAKPVPESVSQDHGDDDFFAGLMDPEPAAAPARVSEAAWGANDELNDSGVMMSVPAPPPEPALQPESDPLAAPASRFAAPFRAPVSADLPSGPSESLGNTGRRRRTSVSEAMPGPSGRRRTSGLRGTTEEAPAMSGERRAGRDLTDMADESIQRVLDDEFRLAEDGHPGSGSNPGRRPRGVGAQDDVDDLEALLSRGLGELPSGSGNPRPAAATRTGRQTGGLGAPGSRPPAASSPPRPAGASPRPSSPPPRPSAGSPAPSSARPSGAQRGPERGERSDLESLVRAGLADLERGAAPPRSPPAPAAPRAPASAPRSAAQPTPAPAGAGLTFSTAPPGADLDELMGQARRKQSLGDFTGSLQLVEQVLSANPDHVEARRYLTENTSRLLEMYRSRIGKLSSRPRLKLRPQEIIWQSLDHRAGFLVSQVDGQTTYEEIIEISGLSELEATRILARLVDQGVIG